MNDKRSIIPTKDGSHTVYSDDFGQHYHNPNGAVEESRIVFFEKTGLLEKLQNNEPVSILETGFGTGLNFLLLMDYAAKIKSQSRITMESVEAFPLSVEEAESLNYGLFTNLEISVPEILTRIFSDIKPGRNQFTFQNIALILWIGTFESWEIKTNSADVFFHDPFSPEANPELWSPEVFEKLKNNGSLDAILATYCAASKARAAMAKSGWFVARSRGALGKREMTLASVNKDRLSDFKRVNEERLIERFYPN